MELTLPADDDYIIQIKALSDGGEGTPTEPINIHKLSKTSLFFKNIIKGESFHSISQNLSLSEDVTNSETFCCFDQWQMQVVFDMFDNHYFRDSANDT